MWNNISKLRGWWHKLVCMFIRRVKVYVFPASTCLDQSPFLLLLWGGCHRKANSHHWSLNTLIDCPSGMWAVVDFISVTTSTSQAQEATPKTSRCFEVCRVHPQPSSVTPLSFSDCCSWSFGGPPRSAARMTLNQSCWRENVWWCATPLLLQNHRAMLWACP